MATAQGNFADSAASPTPFSRFPAGVLTVPTHPDDITFNDKDPSKFDRLIPDHAPHREIDLTIKRAVEEGKLNAKVSIVRALTAIAVLVSYLTNRARSSFPPASTVSELGAPRHFHSADFSVFLPALHC